MEAQSQLRREKITTQDFKRLRIPLRFSMPYNILKKRTCI